MAANLDNLKIDLDGVAQNALQCIILGRYESGLHVYTPVTTTIRTPTLDHSSESIILAPSFERRKMHVAMIGIRSTERPYSEYAAVFFVFVFRIKQ